MNRFKTQGLQQLWSSLLRLRIVLFLFVLILLYAFIAWRLQTLVSADPDPGAVALQSKTTAQPSIDQALVDKIKKLEDNSVNVQTLFNNARQNPFRE